MCLSFSDEQLYMVLLMHSEGWIFDVMVLILAEIANRLVFDFPQEGRRGLEAFRSQGLLNVHSQKVVSRTFVHGRSHKLEASGFMYKHLKVVQI